MAQTEQMTASQIQEKVNHPLEPLDVSETRSDLRDLLDSEAQDVRAIGAVTLSCCQVKDKRVEHKQYIDRYGQDMPEIRNWKWELMHE
jgi:phosphoketolase